MNYRPGRIFLSAPHMGGHEKNYVLKAIEDNWVSTAGPNLPGFEHDVCQHTNARHAVALSSGTAALHLALTVAGVQAGDEVLCPTLTHAASANPILHLSATPILVGSERDTWNMSPNALRDAITTRRKQGKRVSAMVLVHLYGMPAKLKELMQVAEEFEVPIVEDAAHALGSRYSGHQVGTFGLAGAFSFDGNKIVTTSGGGALITADENVATQVRGLAYQTQDGAALAQQASYNYRLSNISAGIGRGQMELLEMRVKQRRSIFSYYEQQLAHIEGLEFQAEPKICFSNRWLTTVLLPEGHQPEQIKQALEQENIETRLLCKPLHLQPLFSNVPYFGDKLSEQLYSRGLCLPSGSNLSEEELEKVARILKRLLEPS